VHPCAIDYAVVGGAQVDCCRGADRAAGYMSGDTGIISRQRLVLVLITVDKHRDVLEVAREIFHLRAVDEFLALQHAAEQQADNHQHDGDSIKVSRTDCVSSSCSPDGCSFWNYSESPLRLHGREHK